MKKIKLLLIIFIFFVFSFNLNINAGSIWSYVWEDTSVVIPVGESFDQYKDVPKATLLKDNVALLDASVTYNTEGDWLFYSKNVNTSKIGVYKVWYKAYENKYIPGTCTGYKCLISFEVKDLEAPKVDVIKKEVNIRRGTEYNLINNLTYSDNYTKDLNIEFSGSVDSSKIGTNHIITKVTDESGNVSTCYYDVIVYDDAKPVIECLLDSGNINIPINGEYDLKEYFKATDPFDGDISDRIAFPNIITNKLGKYNYNVSVTNSIGNSCEYKITVNIIDNEPAKIILNNNNIILDYKINIENMNYLSYINRIEDNNDIDYSKINITHDMQNKVGNYHIWYEYDDGFYKTRETLNVTFVSHDAPSMEIDDVIIDVGSPVDLYDYVYVSDESDSSAKSTLVIDDSNVKYDKEGIYYANAYCINSSGLSTERRIKVVVKGNSMFSDNYKNYTIISIIFLGVIIFLIGFIVIYILITKKKINNNKFE